MAIAWPMVKLSKDVFDKICARIASGESLRKICEDDGMPNRGTVFALLRENPEAANQYTRAREAQADCYADEIVAIADGQLPISAVDAKLTEGETDVQRDRVRIDARKWAAGKLRPKVYGDKLELAGDPERPVAVSAVHYVVVDPKEK